jgi:homogentisate 1,2-dioxygenase
LTVTVVVSYEQFKNATEADLQPMRIHEGTIGISVEIYLKQKLIFSAFMFETSMMLTITEFAFSRSGQLHGKH